ncbi:unnamed protein product, partial [Meganyctiphanes norvegica]
VFKSVTKHSARSTIVPSVTLVLMSSKAFEIILTGVSVMLPFSVGQYFFVIFAVAVWRFVLETMILRRLLVELEIDSNTESISSPILLMASTSCFSSVMSASSF